MAESSRQSFAIFHNLYCKTCQEDNGETTEVCSNREYDY